MRDESTQSCDFSGRPAIISSANDKILFLFMVSRLMATTAKLWVAMVQSNDNYWKNIPTLASPQKPKL
jgi:hypothetical protein